MILADKILTLRKSSGWSQEELAEKINVSRQSVSKWESAVSIPDINKIIELAKIFGVTTDYLLRDDIEEALYTGRDEAESSIRVNLEEANSFMKSMADHGRKIGLGVMLCILSPVLLILLAGLTDSGYAGMNEDIAAGVGVTVLLALVACAVAIFITSSMRIKRFEYLQQKDFELEYGIAGIVKERKKSYEGKYSRSIVLGVVLCILCAVPLILAGVAGASETILVGLTGLLLVIVSIAVNIFIVSGTEMSSYSQLLQEGEYDVREKARNKRAEKLGGVYWPVVTAVYLGWSFITGNWYITWVVWPVAALIFGAVVAGLKSKSNS